MKAFLTGLGIGVALGVVFAPEKGEATRRRFRQAIDRWSESLRRQADTLRERVRRPDFGVSKATSAVEDQNVTEKPSKKPQGATGLSDTDSINTASREELMSINGIGPVLADRIISGRPYSSLAELVDRGIVSQSTLDELNRHFHPGQKRSA